jgi:hypothetical protein
MKLATLAKPVGPGFYRRERATEHKRPSLWFIAVFLLSLPSLVFVVLHRSWTPGQLPEIIDLPLSWILAVAGLGGPLTFMVEMFVALLATFQSSVSWKTKTALWGWVALSFLACVYISQVPP